MRGAAAMDGLETTLVAAGYSVANIDYESRSVSIEEPAVL
jgi:hypothetical protein